MNGLRSIYYTRVRVMKSLKMTHTIDLFILLFIIDPLIYLLSFLLNFHYRFIVSIINFEKPTHRVHKHNNILIYINKIFLKYILFARV